MWKYRGFIIVYHQDIGYYAIYRESATAYNMVQSVNHFCRKESCYEYIDKILGGNNHANCV